MAMDKHHQAGIAIVEFTLTLPLLLLLLVVIGEYGRLFIDYTSLQQQTRNGAKYIAEHAIKGSTQVISLDSALVSQTKNLVLGGAIVSSPALLPGLKAADISVVESGDGHIEVHASYRFDFMFSDLFASFGLPGYLILNSSNHMRAM